MRSRICWKNGWNNTASHMAIGPLKLSTILIALTAGTALAGGVIYYDYMQDDTPLAVLDDNLPPIAEADLLPPPLTYYIQEEPDVSIPGIRRLKILRPAIVNTPANGSPTTETISNGDFYLTGSRSSALIRQPVEARVETFPTVTLSEALEGVIANDEFGFQVVQNFFNQSLGDADQLRSRLQALVDELENLVADGGLGADAIADAINIIVESASRAHRGAFMAPVVLEPGFDLKEDAFGFDLGPANRSAYENFVRISSESELLQGRDMEDIIGTGNNSLISEGVSNVDQFVSSQLENGQYRVIALSGRQADGLEPLYPFGVDYKQNGAKINMVDTRATDNAVPLMQLGREGPGRYATAENKADLANVSGNVGNMLMTRADIVDSSLKLNFRQLGGEGTYVTAVILYPEPDDTTGEDLQNLIVELIENLQPAAGGDNLPGTPVAGAVRGVFDNAIGVIDPITALEDAGNGLPTEEGVIAVPLPPVLGGGNAEGDAGGGDAGNPGSVIGGDEGNGDTVGGDAGGDTGGGDAGGDAGGGDAGGGDAGGNAGGGDAGATPGGDPAPEPQLIAEAGIYDPVPLGEDFSLNACGTTLNDIAICDLANTEGFELLWILDGEVIGTGTEVLLNTGSGTFFDSAGDQEVTLQVRFDGEFLGPDGGELGIIGGGSIFLPGDIIITSLDTAVISLFIDVPEPAGLAILGGGLLLLRRREKRRKRMQVSA